MKGDAITVPLWQAFEVILIVYFSFLPKNQHLSMHTCKSIQQMYVDVSV